MGGDSRICTARTKMFAAAPSRGRLMHRPTPARESELTRLFYLRIGSVYGSVQLMLVLNKRKNHLVRYKGKYRFCGDKQVCLASFYSLYKVKRICRIERELPCRELGCVSSTGL